MWKLSYSRGLVLWLAQDIHFIITECLILVPENNMKENEWEDEDRRTLVLSVQYESATSHCSLLAKGIYS